MEITRYLSKALLGRFENMEINIFKLIEGSKATVTKYGYDYYDMPIEIIVPGPKIPLTPAWYKKS